MRAPGEALKPRATPGSGLGAPGRPGIDSARSLDLLGIVGADAGQVPMFLGPCTTPTRRCCPPGALIIELNPCRRFRRYLLSGQMQGAVRLSGPGAHLLSRAPSVAPCLLPEVIPVPQASPGPCKVCQNRPGTV